MREVDIRKQHMNTAFEEKENDLYLVLQCRLSSS